MLGTENAVTPFTIDYPFLRNGFHILRMYVAYSSYPNGIFALATLLIAHVPLVALITYANFTLGDICYLERIFGHFLVIKLEIANRIAIDVRNQSFAAHV